MTYPYWMSRRKLQPPGKSGYIPIMPDDSCIDVSHAAPYQRAGHIRWAEVAPLARVAILRAVYRESPDESYRRHYLDARSAGLGTGAYAFLRPGGMDRQIAAFLAVAAPRRGDLCVADFEDHNGGIPTADELETWCAAVEAHTAADVVVYSRASLIDAHIPGGHPFRGRKRPLWLSQYPIAHGGELAAFEPGHHLDIPDGWMGDECLFWQYTSKGVVPGIDGAVDRSVGSIADLERRWPGVRA